jgi:hypothetical protein
MKKKKGYYRNKQGAWLNRKLIKRAEKLAEQINEQRAEKRSQILSKPFIHAEGSQAVKETVGQYHGQRATKYLGETAFPELNSVRFDPETLQSNSMLERKVKAWQRMKTKKYSEKMNALYKNNLIKSIETKFGNAGDKKEIKEIIKKIKRMSAKELAEFAYTTEVLNIDFVYGNPESEDNYNLFKDTVTDFYNKKYRKRSKI